MEDEKEKIDLHLVCRTCLASDTKFYNLNELITNNHETNYMKNLIINDKSFYNENNEWNINNDNENDELTYWDYLYYCTRLDDVPEFPIQICTKCCTELRVSYNFLINALKTHQILTNYCNNLVNNTAAGASNASASNFNPLNENPRKKLQSSIELPVISSGEARRIFRYRCKVCLEKIETKKLLKEHARLHLDILLFKCKACNFQTRSKKMLNDHYNRVHRIKPSKEMLRCTPATLQQEYDTQYIEYTTKPESQVQILNDLDTDIQETFSPSEILAQQQLEELEQQRLMEQQLQYTNTDSSLPIIELHDVQNAEMQFEDGSSQPITIQTSLPQSIDFHQGHDVMTTAGSEYQTTTEILQQPIQLDATIITTSDGQQIATITQEQLQELQKSLASNSAGGGTHTMMVGNDLNVGNEYVVMSDGSVEQVMGNNVFYEYVNTQNSTIATAGPDGALTLDNGLVLNNFLSLSDNVVVDSTAASNNGVNTSNSSQQNPNIINVNVENMIVDGNHSNILKLNEVQHGKVNNIVGDPNQQNISQAKRKIKCKICSSMFVTQERLKTHMLTHNEIPHFFCDQCAFYTFFKVDLTQHYRTKHKLQPTHKQLQPKNKYKAEEEHKGALSCDLCFFETNMKTYLKRHYLYKHKVEATDIQLRSVHGADGTLNKPGHNDPPDYPKGIGCKRCDKKFFYRHIFREHCKQHILDERRSLKMKKSNPVSSGIKSVSNATTSSNLSSHNSNTLTFTTNKPNLINTSSANVSLSSTKPIIVTASASILTNVSSSPSTSSNTRNYVNSSNMPRVMASPICGSNVTNSSVSLSPSSSTGRATTSALNIVTPPTTNSLQLSSLDMMNSPSSGITASENANTIINNNIDFDFTGDGNFFDDFEEEDHQENDELTNLVLTSDDDFDDILNDNDDHMDVVNNTSQPYCIQCQKKFLTQYQFENHMFVHRGLAPYRCEMCTNLYNTKRALIRHYKAIHKTMPTRDMIQAKGDKGECDAALLDNILEERKSPIFMCFHCPFESPELQNIKIHLRTSHGIVDENYILQKLPYECPQCIRCFAVKARLLRHLDRSHAVTTILQRENMMDSTSATETTKSSIIVNENVDIPLSSSIATRRSSLNLNDDTFPSGISPDEITIAAGVPASLLPVSVTMTSPLLSTTNNPTLGNEHDTKDMIVGNVVTATSLSVTDADMSGREQDFKRNLSFNGDDGGGDDEDDDDDDVIMNNVEGNGGGGGGGGCVVVDNDNGCDVFDDMELRNDIEISTSTTTTIPTSGTNELTFETSNDIETETVTDTIIASSSLSSVASESASSTSPSTPLSSMEVENSLPLQLENDIVQGTLIEEDVIQSATSVGESGRAEASGSEETATEAGAVTIDETNEMTSNCGDGPSSLSSLTSSYSAFLSSSSPEITASTLTAKTLSAFKTTTGTSMSISTSTTALAPAPDLVPAPALAPTPAPATILLSKESSLNLKTTPSSSSSLPSLCSSLQFNSSNQNNLPILFPHQSEHQDNSFKALHLKDPNQDPDEKKATNENDESEDKVLNEEKVFLENYDLYIGNNNFQEEEDEDTFKTEFKVDEDETSISSSAIIIPTFETSANLRNPANHHKQNQKTLLKTSKNLINQNEIKTKELEIKLENENETETETPAESESKSFLKNETLLVTNLSQNCHNYLTLTSSNSLSCSTADPQQSFINEDFDTAEVTITMSATAIGTIIPGAEQLTSTNFNSSLINSTNSSSLLKASSSSSSSNQSLPVSSSSSSSLLGSSFKPNPVYLCNLCSYSCESIEELSSHNDKHSNQKKIISPRLASHFECEICCCKYKSLNLLKHHMKRHIARNFPCPQCPKTYISRNELKQHLHCHAGIKPYKCDICPKKFSYSHHLKRHKEVQHFGKRHICPVNGCGKIFTTMDQMKLHTLNHNGNIPYKCTLCDRDFKKREHLRMHSINTHQVHLTEAEIAEIYRINKGYTNPHDFTVYDSMGQMLRRNDMEAASHSNDPTRCSALIKTENFDDEIVTVEEAEEEEDVEREEHHPPPPHQLDKEKDIEGGVDISLIAPY